MPIHLTYISLWCQKGNAENQKSRQKKSKMENKEKYPTLKSLAFIPLWYEKMTLKEIETLIEELENLRGEKELMETLRKVARENPDLITNLQLEQERKAADDYYKKNKK